MRFLELFLQCLVTFFTFVSFFKLIFDNGWIDKNEDYWLSPPLSEMGCEGTDINNIGSHLVYSSVKVRKKAEYKKELLKIKPVI